MIYAVPLSPQCIVQAAQASHLPVAAIVGVLSNEGGKVGMVHINTDGSLDYGPMQVNSRWLPDMSKFGITPYMLTFNGCLNVWVGAWILRRYVDEAHGRLWLGIGYYHSHTVYRLQNYEVRVYQRLLAMGPAAAQQIINDANSLFAHDREERLTDAGSGS